VTGKLALFLVVVGALAAPSAANAHPLGNFTVNRFSGLEVSGDRVYVTYVLDMAEIPALRERAKIRDEKSYTARAVRQIARGLTLTVDGDRVALRPVRWALAFPPGIAGLRTLRLQAVYATPALDRKKTARLQYRDANFAGRIGWQEVVLRARAGARVRSASVPRDSVSERLLAYPKDLLQSPLEVSEATATLTLGASAGPPPQLLARAELDRRVEVRATSDGGFARLIAREDLSGGFILLSLAVAFFWGAAHAFSPGHGKAIVAGYLVGTRGTARHAALLGLIVTVTHTIGVFALGLLTLALSEFIVPEQLYPWLNLVSALLVVGVGIGILRWRVRTWRRARAHARDGHRHHHGHGGGHRHDHADRGGLRGLLGIGISGGIVPCPTALVVLLAAISLHRVGYGLVLIVAFSVGLAAAVTGIGLLAVSARRLFTRASFDGPLVRALPAASAVFVLALGLVMTVRALPAVT
jgi:ABC-type nickel/cobalt efflux system permease component RcnA